jgi:UDP-2-acetamido-2-deoxy-ribo-hexuluronate aminotransferase
LTRIATTSFFPSKPLGCYGDGGAIFTSDSDLAVLIRQIARHGQDRRYHHVRLGVNSRLDTLQAAILLAKLEIFDEELAARQLAAARYGDLLSGTEIEIPFVADDGRSAWAQNTRGVSDRSAAIDALTGIGVPFAIHYPLPVNRQPAVADLTAILPVGDSAAQRVLSLPMHPYITSDQQALIAQCLHDALLRR